MSVYDINGAIIGNTGGLTDVTDFGATGDGSTDDSNAIRSAFAYCVANNTVLRFPEGTFLLGTTLSDDIGIGITSSVKVEGAGIGKTILKGAASLLGAIHMFHINGADNVEISNMTIDGGLTDANISTAEASAHGIRIANSTNIRIHDVEIKYTSGYAIGQQAGSSQHVTIENVYIHDIARDGIDFKNFSSTNADLTINGATIRRIGRKVENQVGIDIRCDGANLSNIYIDLPDANNASGIRARASNETQGTGGKHINVSNIIIVGNSNNTGEGISANEEGVKIVNAKIEKVGIGIRLYNYAPDGGTQPTESYDHVTNCNILNCNTNAIRADTNGNAIVNCDIGNMGSGLTAIYLAGGNMHSFVGCSLHDCDTLLNIDNSVSKVSLIGCEGKSITTKFSGKTSAVEKIACHGLD